MRRPAIQISALAVAFTVASCVGASAAPAQNPAQNPTRAQSAARALTVFLDCSGFSCDDEFFRTEIVSVNWTRERTGADVHVLATTQPTGGGGTQYTLAFVGQRRFAGLVDTLAYAAPQAGTRDEIRRALARTLQLGLVRYLARTAAAPRLAVTYTPPTATESAVAAPTRDPWNAWVLSVGSNGNLNREDTYTSVNVGGSVAANRVTEAWKTSVSVRENYRESRFRFDGNESQFVQRSYGADLLQVKSLGAHWSAGLRGGLTSSTYLNQRLGGRLTPALEYDLFPYAESTRRQLRLQYGVGASAFSYYDTTQFGKVREALAVQTASAALSRRETWGSVNAGVEAVSYLGDLSRRHLTYSLGADVRVVKGLSVNFFGNYESIHDQFYIPKAGISRDAALLRQTQQNTRFSEFLFVGLRYTFGSVLNNVVNPRFGSNGGGVFFIN